jgi:hypothetical protein
MYKVYNNTNTNICIGKAFELRSKQYGKVIETLFVNLNGDVIKLSNESGANREGGPCTYTSDDSDFTKQVELFMNALIDQNVFEFQRMRNALNTRWRAIAESIRSRASA